MNFLSIIKYIGESIISFIAIIILSILVALALWLLATAIVMVLGVSVSGFLIIFLSIFIFRIVLISSICILFIFQVIKLKDYLSRFLISILLLPLLIFIFATANFAYKDYIVELSNEGLNQVRGINDLVFLFIIPLSLLVTIILIPYLRKIDTKLALILLFTNALLVAQLIVFIVTSLVAL